MKVSFKQGDEEGKGEGYVLRLNLVVTVIACPKVMGSGETVRADNTVGSFWEPVTQDRQEVCEQEEEDEEYQEGGVEERSEPYRSSSRRRSGGRPPPS